MTSVYRLRSGVFYCDISGTKVFLDAKQNKYIRFDSKQSHWFEEIRQLDSIAEHCEGADRFAARLEEKGLIHSHSDVGNPLEEFAWSTANASIYDIECGKVNIPCATREFIAGLAICWLLKRSNKLDLIISKATEWKRKASQQSVSNDFDACQLANAFHNITPLFFSANEACLFRSLALLRFLSRYGVSADWVFGVRLSPFKAHCWLEHDRMLLNEHLELASEYRPIMAV